MIAWMFDFCTLFQHYRMLVVSALQNTAYTENNCLILMSKKRSMTVVVMLLLLYANCEMERVLKDIADVLLQEGFVLLCHLRYMDSWFQSIYDRQKPRFLFLNRIF